jgi:predicted SnoaL-like aldol condensation-catalyzing enzyme
MVTRTQINLGQKGVVAYFVKAMKHYKDKEMLVVPFNMDNHCVTLLISTTDDQV